MVKNLPATQETWVQSLGQEDPLEGSGYPLQYSYLENPMDGGAWWDCSLPVSSIHGVTRVGHNFLSD